MAGAPRYIPKLSTITDNPRPRTSDSDSALEILKKIYASGKISEDEFNKIKEKLNEKGFYH